MRGIGAALALVVLLPLALPATSTAVDLAPVPITPLSVTVDLRIPGDPSSTGMTAANVMGNFEIPLPDGTGTGSAALSAEVVGDEIVFQFEATAENTSETRGFAVQGNISVITEFEVPQGSAPVVPIVVQFTSIDVVAGGWQENFGVGALADLKQQNRLIESALIGHPILPVNSGRECFNFCKATFGLFPTPTSALVHVYAGDRMRGPLSVQVSGTLPPSSSGPTTMSGALRLFALPSTEIGDMNVDGQVNILDSTILRRLLAGFPVEMGSK